MFNWHLLNKLLQTMLDINHRSCSHFTLDYITGKMIFSSPVPWEMFFTRIHLCKNMLWFTVFRAGFGSQVSSKVQNESLCIKQRIKIGNLWEREKDRRGWQKGEQEKGMLSVARCDIPSHDQEYTEVYSSEKYFCMNNFLIEISNRAESEF